MTDVKAVDRAEPAPPPSRPYGTRAKNAWLVFGMVLVMGVGAWLRVDAKAMARAPWFDEWCTVLTANGWWRPVADLPRNQIVAFDEVVRPRHASLMWQDRVGDDMHPPLYAWMLRYWCDAFGWGSPSMRSLSVLLSMLVIVAVGDAARTLGGGRAGLTAAALAACSPVQVFMGQEVRGYVLLCATSALLLAILARVGRWGMSRHGTLMAAGTCASVFALCLALPFTHYYGTAVVAAVALYALCGLRGRDRAAVLMSVVTAGMMWVWLWAGDLGADVVRGSLATAWSAGDGTIRQAVAGAMAAPVRTIATPTPGSDFYALTGVALFLVPAILAVARPGAHRDLLLPLFILSGAVGIVALRDATRGGSELGYARYFTGAAPAVFVLLPVVCARVATGASPAVRRLAGVVAPLSVVYAIISPQHEWLVDLVDFRAFTRHAAKLAGDQPFNLVIFDVVDTSGRYPNGHDAGWSIGRSVPNAEFVAAAALYRDAGVRVHSIAKLDASDGQGAVRMTAELSASGRPTIVFVSLGAAGYFDTTMASLGWRPTAGEGHRMLGGFTRIEK